MRSTRAYAAAAVLSILGLGLVSCSRAPWKKEKHTTPPAPHAHFYYGDLSQALKKMQAPTSLTDECDVIQDVYIQKLIAALNEHAWEILNYKQQQMNELAPFSLAEDLVEETEIAEGLRLRKMKLNRAPKKEVKQKRPSFQELWASVENGGVKTPQDWTQLEGSLRAYFSSELARRVSKQNVYTSDSDWSLMPEILNALQVCLPEANCDVAAFREKLSAKTREHFNENPFMQFFVKDWKHRSHIRQKRQLEALEVYIDANIFWKKPVFVPVVARGEKDGKNSYTVRMKSSFAPENGRQYLKNEIEKFWQNPAAKDGASFTRLKWIDNAESDDGSVFKFIFHADIGRAFVNRGERTLNIFKGGTLHTALHEFGHVLGLPDHYSEYRDMKSCTVVTNATELDIMSLPTSESVVLPSDWKALETLYPPFFSFN